MTFKKGGGSPFVEKKEEKDWKNFEAQLCPHSSRDSERFDIRNDSCDSLFAVTGFTL